jgi:hypothetical protein
MRCIFARAAAVLFLAGAAVPQPTLAPAPLIIREAITQADVFLSLYARQEAVIRASACGREDFCAQAGLRFALVPVLWNLRTRSWRGPRRCCRSRRDAVSSPGLIDAAC